MSMKLRAEIERIGPDKAAEYLAFNRKNRKLKPHLVQRLAGAMSSGHWLLTGEAIKFDREGDLLDGQHRLEAIRVSGVTVDTLVVFGLDPEAFRVMDTGVPRTAADMLQLEGFKNGTILAAAARVCINAARVHPPQTQVDYLDILEYARKHKGLSELTALSMSYVHKETKPPVSLSVLTGVAYSGAHRFNPNAGQRFITGVLEGHNLPHGDPRAALRNVAINWRIKKRPRTWHFAVNAAAWNAYAQGEPLHTIKPLKADRGHYVCPSIIEIEKGDFRYAA